MLEVVKGDKFQRLCSSGRYAKGLACRIKPEALAVELYASMRHPLGFAVLNSIPSRLKVVGYAVALGPSLYRGVLKLF